MRTAAGKQRAAEAAADGVEEIARVRIELVGSDPLIWREVDVPTAITLKGLHGVVQAAMEWLDYHLWEFTVDGRRLGPIELYDGESDAPEDASKMRLGDVLRPRKTRIDYLYDFGDGWEHSLTVTNVRAGELGVGYPRYVAGGGVAPPEDSGGIYGFYDKLEALADPERPDHEDIAEWLGDYDPDKFEDLPIKYAISRIAARRRGGQARKRKAAA
jgi:hypothetical protein